MRHPNSWILDFTSIPNKDIYPYWALSYISQFKQIPSMPWNSLKYKSLNPTRPLLKNSFTSFEEILTVHFLRKEKTYTKLKYSRTPSYDIVSGGVAVIFAGFLGFLTCEKFGFELLDSADFFFLGMYGIFFVFPLGLLLRLASAEGSNNGGMQISAIFFFFIEIFLFFFKKIKFW